MKKQQQWTLRITLAAIALWITACDPLISQNPADFFLNKRFPKQLEWIRSQMREINSKKQEEIAKRVAADAKRNDLVKVAVIDSGVDISHDDLLKQIDYKIENGRIVGAGYDIMGNSRFGSHVLVDPTLFAFGAQRLENNKIVEPVNSPLKLLQDTNERFRDLVLAGIQNDPELSKSLFAKLQRDTFTVFGFEKIKNSPDQYIATYENIKKENRLITIETKPGDKYYSESAMEDWKFMSKEQLPAALGFSEGFEHADRFFKVVTEAYQIIDVEMRFSENVKIFNSFMQGVLKSDSVTQQAKLKEFPVQLRNAMEFVLLGHDMYDPISSLERKLKAFKKYQDLSFEEAFRAYYEDTIKLLQDVVNNPAINKEMVEKVQQEKNQLRVLKSLVETTIELKNDPVAYKKMRSDLRRYVYRSRHPYISSKSGANSHGTHVAGVIAKQNPNIRIVPVRVTTQTTSLSEERSKEINADFIKEFRLFMQTPYYQPLKNKIASEYGNHKMSDTAVIERLSSYLKENGLLPVFIQDVLKAVEAAGAEKAKLANVSLGVTFKKQHDLTKKNESMIEDLFSEFARYKIGQTIKEKAPGTLFMIATGNDGGWIDGVSKTAFPVGITSTRLIEITKNLKLPASPNNSAKNVLAVASINKNGTLTPFTNILLDPNIPQIFSTGEEVMSSVPNKDAKPAIDLATKELQRMAGLVNALAAVEGQTINPISEQALKRIGELSQVQTLSRDMLDIYGTLLHLTGPANRQLMSGTSMATPTVTGILANYIVEKMKAEGIKTADLYTHPDFTPEKLIEDVMKISRSNKLTPMITVQMLVDGMKTWKNPKGPAQQKKMIRSLTKLRCETVHMVY